MPLDHYVSQVHLKNFYASDLGERMYGMRKSDLHVFPCDSQSQCRVPDGSSNKYLIDQRAIEDFLTTIEPKYNLAVDSLRRGVISGEAVYVIAGFISYVTTCSPAAMRLHRSWLSRVVESTAMQLDNLGQFASPPEEIAPETISSLLSSGRVVVDVDPKFPQAIGISNILLKTAATGNSKWEILISNNRSKQFLTSDYPCAIQQEPNLPFFTRTIPLSTDVAVKIYPRRMSVGAFVAPARRHEFPLFQYTTRELNGSEVGNENRQIVRCAEANVYSSTMSPSLKRFVDKNRHFRTETCFTRKWLDPGEMLYFEQRVVPFGRA